jgi:hypothetical protein
MTSHRAEPVKITVEDCSTCAARCNGLLADYCAHAALAEDYRGEGRPIRGYPKKPRWCPGYIPEDDDFEWC